MDHNLQKMIEENNELLKEQLALTKENQKKIQKIQLHIRRTMVIKTIYWLVIIGVTIGAIYVSKPYIKDAVDGYNNFRAKVNQSNESIDNLGNWFKDISLIKWMTGSE